MNNPVLYNRMKEARKALGLTQADLAARVGTTRKTINTVENQIFTPSAYLALKIADALEQPFEAIFSLTPLE